MSLVQTAKTYLKGSTRRVYRTFTFTASAAALAKLESTGRLSRPLVTIHTTGDHIVPEWHEPLYRSKTSRSLSSLLLHSRITAKRYGHPAGTDGTPRASRISALARDFGASLTEVGR